MLIYFFVVLLLWFSLNGCKLNYMWAKNCTSCYWDLHYVELPVNFTSSKATLKANHPFVRPPLQKKKKKGFLQNVQPFNLFILFGDGLWDLLDSHVSEDSHSGSTEIHDTSFNSLDRGSTPGQLMAFKDHMPAPLPTCSAVSMHSSLFSFMQEDSLWARRHDLQEEKQTRPSMLAQWNNFSS